MILIRDVFRCKPGKARDIAERFQRLIPAMERDDEFTNCRVLVDLVGEYWTVVVQVEARDLAQFERHMAEFSARPEVRAVMSGYMEHVEGGYREIYRIVERGDETKGPAVAGPITAQNSTR